jgi:hypothetical protein
MPIPQPWRETIYYFIQSLSFKKFEIKKPSVEVKI